MKRTVQLAKLGANIPAPRGQQKNKHRFHELQFNRLQEKQKKMEAEVNQEIANVNS